MRFARRESAHTFLSRESNKLFPPLSVITHYLKILRNVSRFITRVAGVVIVISWLITKCIIPRMRVYVRACVPIIIPVYVFAPGLLLGRFNKGDPRAIPFATSICNYSTN